MKAYVAFLDQLQGLTKATGAKPDDQALRSALDGQAGRMLRELVPLSNLRTQGAFFTDSSRAERLIESIPADRLLSGKVVDPQCGAGNLLLAAARTLPIADTPEATIRDWGKRLGGIDRDPEFVAAAQSRLWLLAVQRCPRPPARVPDLRSALPLIQVASSLKESQIQGQADVLLLNPPYGITTAPKKCEWAAGSVSAAAVFVDDALKKCKVGCTIAAILPDVLRSGSRYQRWRQTVESLATVSSVSLGGVFDSQTDVDVFSALLLRSVSARARAIWIPEEPTTSQLIGELFDVNVGPVVPFRHPEIGPRLPYLTMVDLDPWKRVTKIQSRRQFTGTTYSGPFVAVRRVSRPDDPFRASATLIDVRDYLAVENHVLICRPKDGTLKSCRVLLKSLKQPETNAWLNRSICCRHLTTRSLLELPIFG